MGAVGEGRLPVGVLFVGDGNGGCEDQLRTENKQNQVLQPNQPQIWNWHETKEALRQISKLLPTENICFKFLVSEMIYI